MDRAQYQREKEFFSEWAACNRHNMMASFPKSGRNHLGRLIRDLSGRIVLPGIYPIEPEISLSEVFLFMAHMGRWEVRGNMGRYILLVRDPRDAILSRTYTQALELELPADQVIHRAHWVIQNIRTWLDYFQTFMRYEPLLVQYEHLCLKPAEVLTAMMEYLGVEPLHDLMHVVDKHDAVKPDPLFPHNFVNRSFRTGYDRYYAHSLKWQTDSLITGSFLDTIWEEAGEVMEHYGYTQGGHSFGEISLHQHSVLQQSEE